MTNEQMVAGLHRMVDNFAKMLEDPMFEGILPTIKLSSRSGDDVICLTVGAEFVVDEE